MYLMQGRRKLFYGTGGGGGGGGGWVKMSATMVGWRRKIWLMQSRKKQSLDQNQNILLEILFFFENIISV